MRLTLKVKATVSAAVKIDFIQVTIAVMVLLTK